MSSYNFNEEEITRGQVNSQGGYKNPASTNPFAFLGGMGKYMGNFGKAYQKYSPYMNLLGAKSGKGMVEGGLDIAARSFIPGYSQIKMFNDITGGINLNKMLGIKNPLSALGRGIFGGGGRSSTQNNAYLAAAGRYQQQLEGQRNAMAEQERNALARRAELQPQLQNAQERALEMMLQGPSSRDLAPVIGAAESRNRTVGAAGEAALQQRFANSGIGGGINAGLAQQQLAAQQGRSAGIANQVAMQQLATRPQMAANAANMLQNADYMAMQEQLYGRQNALQANQLEMQQANQQREFDLAQQRQSSLNRQAEQKELGSLLRMAYPDLKKGYDKAIGYGQGDTFAGTQGTGNDGFIPEAYDPNDPMNMQRPLLPGETSSFADAPPTYSFGERFPAFGNNTVGAPSAVVDDVTIGKIRAGGGRYTEDLGNGLSLLAYQDPITGRFLKMYGRTQGMNANDMSQIDLDYAGQFSQPSAMSGMVGGKGAFLGDPLSLSNLMR